MAAAATAVMEAMVVAGETVRKGRTAVLAAREGAPARAAREGLEAPLSVGLSITRESHSFCTTRSTGTGRLRVAEAMAGTPAPQVGPADLVAVEAAATWRVGVRSKLLVAEGLRVPTRPVETVGTAAPPA